MIIISEKYIVKPEHRQAFIKVREDFAKKVKRDGIRITFASDVDDENIFHTWAEHDTKELAGEIFESGIVQEMMGKIGTFLADTPHIRRLDVSNVETIMES